MNRVAEMKYHRTIERDLRDVEMSAASIADDLLTLREGNMDLDEFIFETDRVIGWIKQSLTNLSRLDDLQSGEVK